MSFRVYLAANFEMQETLRGLRDQINRTPGFRCVSAWLDAKTMAFPRGPDEARDAAVMDSEGVESCDIFVAISNGQLGRGGRDSELGMALALEKMVVLVGQPMHVFHYHPGVKKRYACIEDLRDFFGWC